MKRAALRENRPAGVHHWLRGPEQPQGVRFREFCELR